MYGVGLFGFLSLTRYLGTLFGRKNSWTEGVSVHPDTVSWVGWFSVHPVDMRIPGFLVNLILERVGSRRRLRVVVFEDAIRTVGIWTPGQAAKVASQMEIGEDGNFHYANERSGIQRP